MEPRRQLTLSIILSVLAYFLFHGAVMGLLALIFHMAVNYWFYQLAGSLGIDLLLTVVLLRGRKDFFNLETGLALDKVNLPTLLTMFRITSLPSLLVLLAASRVYPVLPVLLVYLILAFVSDLLDGKVSRGTHQTTRVGQYLDSMSDYAVLVAITLAFAQYGLLSPLFFWACVVRYLSQWAMAGLVFLIQGGIVDPRSSFLGKASVFVTMVVMAMQLLKLFTWFDPWVEYMVIPELLTIAVLALSLGEKLVFFVQDIRRLKRHKPQAGQ